MKYGLETRDIILDAQILFSYLLRDEKLARLQQPEFTQSFKKVLQEKIKVTEVGQVDLMITFVDPKRTLAEGKESMLDNIPNCSKVK